MGSAWSKLLALISPDLSGFVFHMCNSTSEGSRRSARLSVWPRTKKMWVSIHFHVPGCLLCEIRLAFNCCFSSVLRGFQPWPARAEPARSVIACYWYRMASRSRCSSPPPGRSNGPTDSLFSRLALRQTLASHEQREKLQLETRCHAGCQHLKRPRGVAERLSVTKGTVWLYATR